MSFFNNFGSNILIWEISPGLLKTGRYNRLKEFSQIKMFNFNLEEEKKIYKVIWAISEPGDRMINSLKRICKK